MKPRAGFTLLELVVAMAVLLLIAALLLSATSQSSRVLQNTSSKIEEFREARNAFETVTRRLSEATLNTYWDYTYKEQSGKKVPTAYARQSELRFRSGRMQGLVDSPGAYRPTHGVFFQAPAGEVDDDAHRPLDQSLCTWGFFLEAGTDQLLRPALLGPEVPPRTRFRLWELRQSTEKLSVYQPIPGRPNAWFTDEVQRDSGRQAHVLAENIVAFIVLPRLSRVDELARGNKPPLSPRYEYDSSLTSNALPPPSVVDAEINPKNQLPPVVEVVMVAMDETSAARLASEHGGEQNLGIETDDLFKSSTLLTDDPATSQPGDGDLHTLEQRLIAARAHYRIFTTTVAIRGAKWSRAQTN